jgi:hypothetical protein
MALRARNQQPTYVTQMSPHFLKRTTTDTPQA